MMRNTTMIRAFIALWLLIAATAAALAQPNTTTVPRTLMNSSCSANVPLVAAGGTNTVPICWATGALGTMAAQTASAVAITGGTLTGTTVSGLTVTTTTGTLTVTNGKTLAVSNTLTFTGTDSSSVAFGAGGTVAYNTLAGGGTAASLTASNGGIVYSTASALAILSGTATANQMLLSGASTTPAWSTVTHPATTTINQILYSSAANVIAGLATANGGILNTSSTGVPSVTATPLFGVAGTTAGTLRLSGVTSGVVTVATADAAGTWTFKFPTSGGTNLQFLQTDGNGTTAWASPSGSGTVNSGTAGQLAYYATSTNAVSTLGSLGTTTTVLHGNAAGAPSFGAVALTTDVSGILPAANGGWGVDMTAAWPTAISAAVSCTGCSSVTATGSQLVAGKFATFTATFTTNAGASGTATFTISNGAAVLTPCAGFDANNGAVKAAWVSGTTVSFLPVAASVAYSISCTYRVT